MKDTAYLVLGASGGIGSELSRRLAAAGARLMLAGRDESALRNLSEELDLPYRLFDAREPAQVEASAREAREAFGRLDGIANCVGSLLLKPAHRTTPEEWDEVIATNLRSAFGAVRAAAASLDKGGSLVLVSTAAARIGLANHEAIAAAKAGVEGLARAAAATYARKRMRVNVVAPGLVRTSLAAPVTGHEAVAKASAAMHALGRLGEPDEVAAMIAWLLDPAQGWITGQVFGVDGGLGTLRPTGAGR